MLAVAFAAAGAATIAALFVVQSFPQPWWLWAVFAGAFVVLEFASVEVSDRLFISSSIMVGFTAAVVFGRGSAVLAVALMAAVAVFHPDDLRQRRWRQPAGNFGQLVLSAGIGAAVFVPFLPPGEVTVGDLPLIALGAAIAATVHGVVNFGLVSFFVRLAYPGRSAPPWSQMLPTHATLTVLGAFGAILGAAFVLAGPVTLPLILITFLVGHVAFATYSNLRRAHEDTIRGFVKAIEALDPYTRGHTERVAHFVGMTADRLGLSSDRRERLRWAALIHDVGKVAVPAELLFKPEAVGDDEYHAVVRHMRVVEDLLARVDFLAPMVEIVVAHHTVVEGGDPDAPIEARILAVADAFDAMTSTRSYRAAITQAEAFERLRERSAVFGSDAVEALIEAIDDRGEAYGSPDAESAAAVERLVRERALRA